MCKLIYFLIVFGILPAYSVTGLKYDIMKDLLNLQQTKSKHFLFENGLNISLTSTPQSIFPNKIIRKFSYKISYVSSTKNFQEFKWSLNGDGITLEIALERDNIAVKIGNGVYVKEFKQELHEIVCNEFRSVEIRYEDGYVEIQIDYDPGNPILLPIQFPPCLNRGKHNLYHNFQINGTLRIFAFNLESNEVNSPARDCAEGSLMSATEIPRHKQKKSTDVKGGVTWLSPSGEKGAKGDKGDRGLPGAQGPKGDSGSGRTGMTSSGINKEEIRKMMLEVLKEFLSAELENADVDYEAIEPRFNDFTQ